MVLHITLEKKYMKTMERRLQEGIRTTIYKIIYVVLKKTCSAVGQNYYQIWSLLYVSENENKDEALAYTCRLL